MMNHLHFLSYIDPGTGSMLFTVIIGIVTTLFFVLRGLYIKFKYVLQGGNVKEDKNKVPCVIFTDSKRYWNVFKPICDEMERRGFECEYWTASPDDPALSEEYEHITCRFIGEGNKPFARLNIMNARLCLSTTPGLDVLQWKRSKNVEWYAHIYHSVGDNLVYRMFGLDYYDAVLASGEIQERAVRTLEEKRGIPAKEIVMVGSTYLDVMKERKAALPDVPHERTTILLAPSWGDSSILNKYGAEFLQKLVDTGYRIIVRPHPQSKISDAQLLEDLQKQFPESDDFSWNYDNDNFNVLNEADLMISDFSGVMFDYTFIFDKPLIYTDTTIDISPYDAKWVDYTTWTLAILPSLGQRLDPSQFDHMKDVIDETLASQKYVEGRKKARQEAWQHPGEAAVRTVDYLEAKMKELLEKQEEQQAKISKKKKAGK